MWENKKNKTHEEHFVPVGYLKGFKTKNTKVDKTFVYQTNVHQCLPSQEVPADSICKEHDLYETKDEFGNYIALNITERSLKRVEDLFYKTRNAIKNRINTVNFGISNVLTDAECCALRIMVAIQLMRHPAILQIAKNEAVRFYNDSNLQKHHKELLARLACLPMWGAIPNNETSRELLEIQKWANKPPILMENLKQLSRLNVRLGYNPDGKIITCDQPVVVFIDRNKKGFDITNIIFPLSSELVLFLYDDDIDTLLHNQEIVLMSNPVIYYVIQNVVQHANNWIYSNSPLTTQQLETVKRIKQ